MRTNLGLLPGSSNLGDLLAILPQRLVFLGQAVSFVRDLSIAASSSVFSNGFVR